MRIILWQQWIFLVFVCVVTLFLVHKDITLSAVIVSNMVIWFFKSDGVIFRQFGCVGWVNNHKSTTKKTKRQNKTKRQKQSRDTKCTLFFNQEFGLFWWTNQQTRKKMLCSENSKECVTFHRSGVRRSWNAQSCQRKGPNSQIPLCSSSWRFCTFWTSQRRSVSPLDVSPHFTFFFFWFWVLTLMKCLFVIFGFFSRHVHGVWSVGTQFVVINQTLWLQRNPSCDWFGRSQDRFWSLWIFFTPIAKSFTPTWSRRMSCWPNGEVQSCHQVWWIRLNFNLGRSWPRIRKQGSERSWRRWEGKVLRVRHLNSAQIELNHQ